MSDSIIATRTSERHFDGRPVVVTEKFHTKNPDGKRTIRMEYKSNMPAKRGGWMSGTVTEQVIEGRGGAVKILIPEHRVA